MSDRILTLAQVADEQIVPLPKSSLYRAAAAGDGPFRKVRGRWMAYESDIRNWVRQGERKGRTRRPDPMPKPVRSKAEQFLSEVQKLRD